MKKLFTFVICLVLLTSVMIPVSAAPNVVFTYDSSFTSGGKLTVDIMAMTQMDATIYNAWLEGDVVYHWYVDGVENPELNGSSITLTQEQVGHFIHVEVVCYDLTVYSERSQVTNGASIPSTESTQPTTASTSASTSATTSNNLSQQTTQDPSNQNQGRSSICLPWWGILLIVLASAGLSAVVTVVVTKKH